MPSTPFVDSFDSIRGFISDVISKIETFDPAKPTSSKHCVVVVNSETDIENVSTSIVGPPGRSSSAEQCSAVDSRSRD